jgi:hypothetical protein
VSVADCLLLLIFAVMEMTEHLKIFIREHADDDVLELLLNE